MAMAAGEWVSVSSQSDVERADLARERLELERDPDGELEELTRIYQGRGLTRDLAEQVAGGGWPVNNPVTNSVRSG
jgi:VIT1/CCC1 family predicted Fe2+/Mn2+ transporter